MLFNQWIDSILFYFPVDYEIAYSTPLTISSLYSTMDWV